MKAKTRYLTVILIICLFTFLFPLQVNAQSGQPLTVVLFISTSCPHCHNVLEYTIKPLLSEGDIDIEVALINVSTGGADLFQKTVDAMNVPPELRGTPLLVIGDTYMVGDQQIPAELPGKLAQAQSNEQLRMPQVPELQGITASEDGSVAILTASNIHLLNSDGTFSEASSQALVWGWESYFIVFTILFLLATAAVQIYFLFSKKQLKVFSEKKPLHVVFWILMLVGLIIAGYLSYTEVFNKDTICLGYSGCDTVQRSPYARIFGIIPVAVTGLLCYGALALSSLIHLRSAEQNVFVARYFPLGIFTVFTLNNLFLLVLNFLELFVLKALCIWCFAFALTNIALSWLLINSSRSSKKSSK